MFTKIENGKAFNEIAKQIIECIKNGKLEAGSALPGAGTMAEELGISRDKVESSLEAMSLLGILKPAPGNAYYVADDLGSWIITPLSMFFQLNSSYVRQRQQLRAALEVEAAMLAARKCTPLDAVQLLDILNRMEAEEDEEKKKDLDHELHEKISEIADNPLIHNILLAADELTGHIIAETRGYIYSQKKTVAEADRQHRALVEAIIGNEESEASRYMFKHMQLTEKYLVERKK